MENLEFFTLPVQSIVLPVAAWTVFWTFCTFVVAPLIWRFLPWTGPSYVDFSWERKTDWNIRLVSCTSATASVILSFKNLLLHLSESETDQRSKEGSFPLIFMMGFFTLDFFMLIPLFNHYGKKQCLQYFSHHIVSITGFFLAVRYQSLLWYANYRLLSEFSTPFISWRFFMQDLGMRDSKLYGVNRILILISFCLCRIIPIPKFWMAVFYNTEKIIACPKCVVGILLISGVVLDGLNINWFSTIIKIALNELRKIPAIAMEKSELIRAGLQAKKETMIRSFNDAKGHVTFRMGHIKTRVKNRVQNVRQRLVERVQ